MGLGKVRNKVGLFEVSVILFFYILPIVSTYAEYSFTENSVSKIFLKWVVFWGIGMRLFTCGIKQIIQPSFTAMNIFEIEDKKVNVIVRELGFSNTVIGVCAIFSLNSSSFRAATCFIGIGYYLLSFLQHFLKKSKNHTEWFVTVTDFTIVLELILAVWVY